METSVVSVLQILGSEITWAVAGVMLSAVTTGFAVVESTKKDALRKQFAQYRRNIQNRTWGHIHAVLLAFDTLEEARNTTRADAVTLGYRRYEEFLSDEITSARKATVAAYLRLLEQAVNDQESFTRQTAERWRDDGKLENEWRFNAALKFVD